VKLTLLDISCVPRSGSFLLTAMVSVAVLGDDSYSVQGVHNTWIPYGLFEGIADLLSPTDSVDRLSIVEPDIDSCFSCSKWLLLDEDDDNDSCLRGGRW